MTTATAKTTSVEATLVQYAHDVALQEARKASQAFALKHFGGGDDGACGFAWVNVYGVKGNTRLGKALVSVGFRKSYTRGLQLWNGRDGWYFGQSVDAAEAGAVAYAKKFRELTGIESVYAGSRLD